MEEKNIAVFHIGMPKTGSTALQNFLEKNNEQLKQKGWLYSKCTYGNLPFMVGNPPDRKNGGVFLVDNVFEDFLDEFLKKLNHHNMLISNENIWVFDDVQLEKFFSAILERYGNIKIVVYLRRQDEFIESFYNQRVKQFGSELRILSEFIKDLDLKERVFNYLHKLKILERLVGDRLIVRRYSKDIISDFLSVIGVELENVEMPPVDRSNLSLGSRLLEIRRVMKSVPALPIKWDIPIRYLNVNNVVSGRKDYYKIMSPEMRRDILREYESDNEEIARRYLKDGKPLFEDMNVDIPYKEYRATPLEEEMIRVFFTFMRNMDRQMKNMAIKLIDSRKKLAYFGAGNICRKCLESGLYRPDIIIDDKGGREIDGIPVVSLNEVKKLENYYVIITTTRFQQKNSGFLQEHGLREIHDWIVFRDLDWN